jgi:hypothetical protein
VIIHAKTLNNTAYHYDTKQDDSDGYYGYDVNEKVVKSDYVTDQTLVLEQDEQVSTLSLMTISPSATIELLSFNR